MGQRCFPAVKSSFLSPIPRLKHLCRRLLEDKMPWKRKIRVADSILSQGLRNEYRIRDDMLFLIF
jgi:hypothetical protein